MHPFPFEQGSSTSVLISTTSVTTALPAPLTNRTVHLANLTADNPIFVRFGVSNVVATTNDTAVLPFESMVFTVPDIYTHVAAIATNVVASGLSLNITSGRGGMD